MCSLLLQRRGHPIAAGNRTGPPRKYLHSTLDPNSRRCPVLEGKIRCLSHTLNVAIACQCTSQRRPWCKRGPRNYHSRRNRLRRQRCNIRRQSTPGRREPRHKSPPSSCNWRMGPEPMRPNLAAESSVVGRVAPSLAAESYGIGALALAELFRAACWHWTHLWGLLRLSDEGGRGQTLVAPSGAT